MSNIIQEYFYTLADAITALLQGKEVYTCSFRAEDAAFVRFAFGLFIPQAFVEVSTPCRVHDLR